MDIRTFLDHSDWDKPFFKSLANNDTTAAPGHQGGLVVPKDLRRFFPGLLGRISASTPTLDRRILTDLYEGRCCVCGTGLRVPSGPYEIEAAHIVPHALRGCDDARNGLALCRRHHWAFDRGLFGVDASRLIHVPASILREPVNQPLQIF